MNIRKRAGNAPETRGKAGAFSRPSRPPGRRPGNAPSPVLPSRVLT